MICVLTMVHQIAFFHCEKYLFVGKSQHVTCCLSNIAFNKTISKRKKKLIRVKYLFIYSLFVRYRLSTQILFRFVYWIAMLNIVVGGMEKMSYSISPLKRIYETVTLTLCATQRIGCQKIFVESCLCILNDVDFNFELKTL